MTATNDEKVEMEPQSSKPTTVKPKRDWSKPQPNLSKPTEEKIDEEFRSSDQPVYRHPRSQRVVIRGAPKTKKQHQREVLLHTGIVAVIFTLLIWISLKEFNELPNSNNSDDGSIPSAKKKSSIWERLKTPDNVLKDQKKMMSSSYYHWPEEDEWDSTKYCGAFVAPSTLGHLMIPPSQGEMASTATAESASGYSLFTSRRYDQGDVVLSSSNSTIVLNHKDTAIDSSSDADVVIRFCQQVGGIACLTKQTDDDDDRLLIRPALITLIKPHPSLANVYLNKQTGHLMATKNIPPGTELFYYDDNSENTGAVVTTTNLAPSRTQYDMADDIIQDIYQAQRKRNKRDPSRDSASKRAMWGPAETLLSSVVSKFDHVVGNLISKTLFASGGGGSLSTSSAYAAMKNHTTNADMVSHCADSIDITPSEKAGKNESTNLVSSKRYFQRGQLVLVAPLLVITRKQSQEISLVQQLQPYCFQTTNSLFCPSTLASQLVYNANQHVNSEDSCEEEKSNDGSSSASTATCHSASNTSPKVKYLKYTWSPWNDRNKNVLLEGPIAESDQAFILGMTVDFIATTDIEPGDILAIQNVDGLFRSAWE